MQPYLIALDLDGTLLKSDMTIGDKTKRILEHLHRQGHCITIATGRILQLAQTVPTDLGFPAHVVACNGAIVKHSQQGIIAAHTYTNTKRRLLEETLEHLNQTLEPTQPFGMYFHYYSEDTIYASALEHTAKKFSQISSQRPENERVKLVILSGEVLANSDANIYKYGIYNDGSYDFMEARRQLDSIAGLTTMFSAPNLLDIMVEGVSKWTGITELAAHLEIPRERIMVFGDNENDVEMLQEAGIGIAMGNARDDVKAVAKYVTDSNDCEGIYSFLKKHFRVQDQ